MFHQQLEGGMEVLSIYDKIYSGMVIPVFYSRYGPEIGSETEIFIELTEESVGSIKSIRDLFDDGVMRFPRIIEVDADFYYFGDQKAIDPLFDACKTIQWNISARKRYEFLFEYGEGRRMAPNALWFWICTKVQR